MPLRNDNLKPKYTSAPLENWCWIKQIWCQKTPHLDPQSVPKK